MQYLFLCKSLTYAQRSARMLEQKGIGAYVSKAPDGISANGCAYCVKIRAERYEDALSILRSAGLGPKRIFRLENDMLSEVAE